MKKCLWIIVCIVIAITFFVIGFFQGELVYMWIITPSHDVEGNFDYGIMWTACGAIGTVFVSIVAIWQTSRANRIARNLMDIENNRFRPYVKLKIGDYFFINKDAFPFSNKVEDICKKDVYYEGRITAIQQNTDDVLCLWPIVAKFLFSIENIGESSIANIELTRLIVLNNGIGIVKHFSSSIDASLFAEEKKDICINVVGQVLSEDNGETIVNTISLTHQKMLDKPIRRIQIELGLKYIDIYGRTFYQEYTVHLAFDLKQETKTEYHFAVKNSSIEHHIGISPYGPRIE